MADIAHNGKNLSLHIPALIDTEQNIKVGFLLSRYFCQRLGLVSELVLNSGISLNCANQGIKIRVLGEAEKGCV